MVRASDKDAYWAPPKSGGLGMSHQEEEIISLDWPGNTLMLPGQAIGDYKKNAIKNDT